MAVIPSAPPPDSPVSVTASTSTSTPTNEYSSLDQQHPNTPVSIHTWTASTLQSLDLSSVVGPHAISIDEAAESKPSTTASVIAGRRAVNMIIRRSPSARDTSARDNLGRREKNKMGREGTRQRRRWENDHLIGVPHVQAPQPCDILIYPTYPIRNVPYHLAQLWDRDRDAPSSQYRPLRNVCQLAEDMATAQQMARKTRERASGRATGHAPGEVSRELRNAIKRSGVVWEWVRGLEEAMRTLTMAGAVETGPDPTQSPVARHSRKNSEEWEEVGRSEAEDIDDDDINDDDGELIFVGRRRGTSFRKASRTGEEGMVLDTVGQGEGAAFKRWLAHSVADYYGLSSRSVNIGNRRVIYVGGSLAEGAKAHGLPRPVWEVCRGRW